MMTLIIFIVLGFFIYLFVRNQNSGVKGLADNRFKSKISRSYFPDRSDAIDWHINTITKGLGEGDLELVNTSYAKLIESIRQQNLSDQGRHDDILKAVREEYQEFRRTYGFDYPKQFLPENSQKERSRNVKDKHSDKGIVINPGSNFELTLFNAPPKIIRQVSEILGDDTIWNKEGMLMPIFATHNVKCREVEDYKNIYKPHFDAKIEQLKNNSVEYLHASETDRKDMEREFAVEAITQLGERAACDLGLLFQSDKMDSTVDDELISEYGFETISKYVALAKDFDRIRIDYDRKEFEDLLTSKLAVSGESIPLSDILRCQTLKTLNQIANKEKGFFKRKDKAIDYILLSEEPKKDIGQYISLRRIFRLLPMPDKYAGVQLSDLAKLWAVTREEIRLVANTFRDSQRYTDDISQDKSWVRSYSVEKQEDFDSEFICQRARMECSKK